jgi:diadenylate cyclase
MHYQDLLAYFRKFSAITIVDIALAGLLLYALYRSVKGTSAVNLLLGIVLVNVVFALSRWLKMDLLSGILERVISAGLVGLIVVFQPEIRKFLINIARNSPVGKNGFLSKFFSAANASTTATEEDTITHIGKALKYFVENKIGALLVFSKTNQLEYDGNGAVLINGLISSKLLESIFEKASPLHDGAVILDKDRVLAAKVVLPLTDTSNLPSTVGLRHRAAVGITEVSDVFVIVVSETTGIISYAEDGVLTRNATIADIKQKLFTVLVSN